MLLASLGVLSQGLSAFGATITYDIWGYVDGRDLLSIQGDTVQWDHLDFAAVGRWAGINPNNDLPTIINNSSWYPWDSVGPGEFRSGNILSGVGTLSALNSSPLPSQSESVSLHIISARESLSISQLPNSGNGFTLILDFNDDDASGPIWYGGEVTVTTTNAVPDSGGTVMLLGLGLCGIGLVSISSRKRPKLGQVLFISYS